MDFLLYKLFGLLSGLHSLFTVHTCHINYLVSTIGPPTAGLGRPKGAHSLTFSLPSSLCLLPYKLFGYYWDSIYTVEGFCHINYLAIIEIPLFHCVYCHINYLAIVWTTFYIQLGLSIYTVGVLPYKLFGLLLELHLVCNLIHCKNKQ